MKKNSAIYYLLFVLIVMGAFASMAQNAYGLKICGIACLGFAFTFLNELFISDHTEDELKYSPWIVYGELISLTVIALVFFLRIFSLDFPFFNLLLVLATAVLWTVLLGQATFQLRQAKLQGGKLFFLMGLYYGSVLVFISAFLADLLLIRFANFLVIVAMILAMAFVIFALAFRTFSFKGELISAWRYVGMIKNRSAILLIACLLIYGYNMLYSVGALPSLYHGVLPNGYQRLVETSVKSNDQQRVRDFKEQYEKLTNKYTKD